MEPGQLMLRVGWLGTYVQTQHDDFDSVVGQGAIPIIHDQELFVTEARLVLDMGLAERFSASLVVPVRVVSTSIVYRDGRGDVVQLEQPSTHHRDETLTGIADPMLLGAFTHVLAGTRLVLRAGLTFPLGRTEEDPFAGADMPHQHIQMGTGTINPVAALEASRAFGTWRAGIFAFTQQTVYENKKGYHAGDRYAAGLSLRRALGQRWSVRGGPEMQAETAERWNGVRHTDEGNQGRIDVMIGAGAAWRATPNVTLDMAVKVPVYTHVVGGQLESPAIVEVGASWALGTPMKKNGGEEKHEHAEGDHGHAHEHAEGEHAHAAGAHAQGEHAHGEGAHPQGDGTHAHGDGPHAQREHKHGEGAHTQGEQEHGDGAHPPGDGTHAQGEGAHAQREGSYDRPHAQADRPHAQADRPHAQANHPHAQADRPHAQGEGTQAPAEGGPRGGDRQANGGGKAQGQKHGQEHGQEDGQGPKQARGPHGIDITGLDVVDLGKNGERVSLVGVPGKITIFDFWAEWCEPCKTLEPALVEMARAHPDRVAIRRVDVVDWDSAVAAQHLTPGGFGLPHLKVVDGRGKLVLEKSSAPGKLQALIDEVRGLVEPKPATARSPVRTPPAKAGPAVKPVVVAVEVTPRGFAPRDIKVPRGRPVVLRFHRSADKTCATEVVFEHDGKRVLKDLPLGKTVELAITFGQRGRIEYGCAMNKMIGGTITVE